MASSPTSSQSPQDAPMEEEEDNAADLPLTMAASVVLDHLPKDAHKALETAGELPMAKGRPFDGPLALRHCTTHLLPRCESYGA